jgi:hypothetical protein
MIPFETSSGYRNDAEHKVILLIHLAMDTMGDTLSLSPSQNLNVVVFSPEFPEEPKSNATMNTK